MKSIAGLFFLFLGLVLGNNAQAQCPILNQCTPGNASNPQAALFGGGILQVRIGTGFTNATAGASEGYQDYCSLGAVPVTLGSPISISILTGNNFNENVRVFVDVNGDNEFTAATETFFSSNNAKTHNGALNISTGVVGQQIKLRISSDLITAANLPSPCSTPEYSQVEDYAIILQQNVNPPIARFTVSDTLTCSGSVTFTDQSINNPASWLWSFGDGNTSTQQNPQHQYTTAGVFSVKLKVTSTNGVDSLLKTNYIRYNDSVPAAAVCNPTTFNQCCGYGITRFQIGALNNSSTVGSYEDFSCQKRTTLIIGRSYPIELATNPNQNQDSRVWIDFNNNGIFENNELIYEALGAINPSGNIVLQNDTSIKFNRPLRLRVMSEFAGGPFSYCTNLDKGQCEDYTVYLKENNLPPVANFVLSAGTACQPTFTLTSTSENVVSLYHWYFGDGQDSVTTSPSIQHTYTTTGTYSVKLVVVGPSGADSIEKPAFIVYVATPVPACDLETSTQGPQLGTGIQLVQFGSIDKTSGTYSDGYEDFTCTDQAQVWRGETYSLRVVNHNQQLQKVRAWIDWNNDGNFVASEEVMNSTNNTEHQVLVTVPQNAEVNSVLRMRIASNLQNAQPINSACGTIQVGQAEDYGVLVRLLNIPPVANFFSLNPSTCTGVVAFQDSSDFFPNSYLWDFGDNTTSTDPAPVHTYTSTGSYTVRLIVSNAFGSDTLVKNNYVTVTSVTGMVPATCEPVTQAQCCNYGIANVSFAGINQISGDATEGNRNFTCGTIGNPVIGAQTPISILNSGSNPEDVYVWIDWNNNGDFASDELVFSSLSAVSHSGTITIPQNASAGLGLRMRVRSDATGNPQPVSACGALQFGQVEDYQLVVQGNSLPPQALFEASPRFTCEGTISFSDTSFNGPTSWKWYFGDGDSSTLRNPVHTYTSPGLYTVRLVVSNQNGTSELVKTDYVEYRSNENLKPAPCIPNISNTTNPQNIGIRRVSFNTILRNSGIAPAELYTDNACQFRTTVIAGNTYALNVQTSPTTNENCRAWIDWNNNGLFEDPSERVLTSANATSHTASILVPATARVDTALRMRVVSEFPGVPGANNLQPCGNLIFGQPEDYSIKVIQNTTPPVAKIRAASVTSCNGFIQFRDSSSFVPTAWFWQFGDGGTSTLKNPLHQYLNTGTYSVKLRVSNAFGADSMELSNYITITGTYGPKPANCTNSTVNPGVQNGTTLVQFGSLSKVSGFAAADGGYVDYSCTDSANIVVTAVNQQNTITINTSAGNVRENVRVFIDYNNNGAFENSETVLNSQNNIVHTANLVVNQAQCLGVPVRMRVLTDNRQNFITNSCYNPQAGQVEDYMVRLTWVVSANDLLTNYLVVYPNPSEGDVQVAGLKAAGSTWSLLDVNGRLVESGKFEDSMQHSLNLAGVPNGVYQLRVFDAGSVQTRKIVIQK